MIWEEIVDLYVRGCGNSEFSKREKWLHLNHALQKLTVRFDDPYAKVVNVSVSTVANQDWINLATVAAAEEGTGFIRSVENVSDVARGRKLDKEPGGFKGRKRYYEAGFERPPLGSLSHWEREGDKLYLRDTPDASIVLSIDYKKLPDVLSGATILTTVPEISPDYHMAIVHFAIANYLQLHPPMNIQTGGPDLSGSRSAAQAAEEIIQLHRTVNMEENRDQRHYTRQRGYSFNVSGR